ncbi:hypothetical protein [Streptomyces sp. BP-8]|uniref:Uncharacterized protein n=1 Tax=Streptomyces sirii TaxID=3127701 RepID=A0ABZ2QSR4_9ACTN
MAAAATSAQVRGGLTGVARSAGGLGADAPPAASGAPHPPAGTVFRATRPHPQAAPR